MQKLGNNRTLNVLLLAPLIIACLVARVAGAGDAGGKPQETKSPGGVAMILLPGGSFTMGNAKGSADEQPHKVTVSAFYIDKYKVSQEEYLKVVNENPAKWKGKDNPVEEVRWSDAVRYCNLRSKLDGLKPCYDLTTWECDFSANGYRLPTEAEWEFAARAGKSTRFSFGDDLDYAMVDNYAWTTDNSADVTHPVGKKTANAFGLYDIYGNVFEWCQDWFGPYTPDDKVNPTGPASGTDRIYRGGSWGNGPADSRAAARGGLAPESRLSSFGFRLVLAPTSR